MGCFISISGILFISCVQDYSPSDYFTEFGNLVKEMSADSKIPTPNMLMGVRLTPT